MSTKQYILDYDLVNEWIKNINNNDQDDDQDDDHDKYNIFTSQQLENLSSLNTDDCETFNKINIEIIEYCMKNKDIRSNEYVQIIEDIKNFLQNNQIFHKKFHNEIQQAILTHRNKQHIINYISIIIEPMLKFIDNISDNEHIANEHLVNEHLVNEHLVEHLVNEHLVNEHLVNEHLVNDIANEHLQNNRHAWESFDSSDDDTVEEWETYHDTSDEENYDHSNQNDRHLDDDHLDYHQDDLYDDDDDDDISF
jgi:hypothetical protein